jgi:hypothetical protein
MERLAFRSVLGRPVGTDILSGFPPRQLDQPKAALPELWKYIIRRHVRFDDEGLI